MSAGRDAALPTVAGGTARARAGAVLGGVMAALVVWGIAELAVDDLRQPGFGSADPQDLNVVAVTLAALVGGLVGWAALALVERVTSGRPRLWIAVMVVAVLLSLGGPLSGDGVTPGNRAALVALHLSVAAVALPLLYRTSAASAASERRNR